MVISGFSGRHKMVTVFLGLATVWSGALVVLALILRQPTSTSGDVGTHIASGATLVQENGPKVLIPVGLPLVLTLCVALLMWSHYRRHRPLLGVGVWVCVGLLLALSLLAILSIGIFILPVAVLVVLAAAYATPP
jgi:hypothetical protein